MNTELENEKLRELCKILLVCKKSYENPDPLVCWNCKFREQVNDGMYYCSAEQVAKELGVK